MKKTTSDMVKVTIEGEGFAALVSRKELRQLRQRAENKGEHVMELVGRALGREARIAHEESRRPIPLFGSLSKSYSAKLRRVLAETEIPEDHVGQYAATLIANGKHLSPVEWLGNYAYRSRAAAERVVRRLAAKGGKWPNMVRQAMKQRKVAYYSGNDLKYLRIDLPVSESAPAMECPTAAGR